MTLIASRFIFIVTNRGMLFVLLRNLIENGIKYNNSTHPIIKIKLDENENFFTFSVSDNGIGIEQKYHDRIFGLFKRLHNRESYEGSGLGLSISKKVVNRLNGEIWLESVSDNGSTFYFTIPKVNLN